MTELDPLKAATGGQKVAASPIPGNGGRPRNMNTTAPTGTRSSTKSGYCNVCGMTTEMFTGMGGTHCTTCGNNMGRMNSADNGGGAPDSHFTSDLVNTVRYTTDQTGDRRSTGTGGATTVAFRSNFRG